MPLMQLFNNQAYWESIKRNQYAHFYNQLFKR